VSSAILAAVDLSSYRLQVDEAVSLDALAKDRPDRDAYIKIMSSRGFVGAWRREFGRPSGETVPYVVIAQVFVYDADRGAIDEYTADAAQMPGLGFVDVQIPETIGDGAAAGTSHITFSGSQGDVYQIVFRSGNVASLLG